MVETQEYEFTEEQNAIISSLALRVTIVGVINILAAIAMWLGYSQTGNPMDLFNGVIVMIGALAFITPMQDLTKVVKSEGSDISDLRSAFIRLNQFWIVFIFAYAFLRIQEYVRLL